MKNVGITKEERLYIRATSEEKDLLERAAKATKTTRSQFVLRQALDAAERLLEDRTRFVLDEESWNRFCALLDAPDRDLPNVRRLAQEPSPFRERK